MEEEEERREGRNDDEEGGNGGDGGGEGGTKKENGRVEDGGCFPSLYSSYSWRLFTSLNNAYAS